MCQATKSLDKYTNQDFRLTQNMSDVVAVFKTTDVINGKAINEAIEFGYADNKTEAYKIIAELTDNGFDKVVFAHKAYTVKVALIFEARELERKEMEAIAKADSTKKEVSPKTYETETKLNSMSDKAIRELGKGTTTPSGNKNQSGVTSALEILAELPPKATAVQVKAVRIKTEQEKLIEKIKNKYEEVREWSDEAIMKARTHNTDSLIHADIRQLIKPTVDDVIAQKEEIAEQKREEIAQLQVTQPKQSLQEVIDSEKPQPRVVEPKHEDFEMNKLITIASKHSVQLRVPTRTKAKMIDKDTKAHMVLALKALGYSDTDIKQFRS